MRPTLTIASPKKLKAPQTPAIDDPNATVWCDRHGSVGALSHLVGDEHWLHVTEVASFRLEHETNHVTAVPAPGAHRADVLDEYQRTIWPTLLQLQGWEVLHASAVRTAQGVVAFCAASETGKSTLAYGLQGLGYRLWADDAVVFEVTQTVNTCSLPFQVRLRAASAAYFGHAARGAERVRRAGPATAEPLPLLAICALEQVPSLPAGRAACVARLGAAEALTCTLQNALYFSLGDPARKRRMMTHYLGLVAQVPVYRVRFRRGLETLPDVLEALRQHVLGDVPESSGAVLAASLAAVVSADRRADD